MASLFQLSDWRSLSNRMIQGMRRSLFWRSCILALVGVSLVLISRVSAAETVLLQYRAVKLDMPLRALKDFTKTGTLTPELQDFFAKTRQDPAVVQDYLNRSIRRQSTPQISAASLSLLPTEFILLQINKLVGDSLGRENVEALKVAFDRSTQDDNHFSAMEIVEYYPGNSVRLSLDQLLPIYRDVDLFVRRISPVLEVAQQLLPELLCNCQVGAGTPAKQALKLDATTLPVASVSPPLTPQTSYAQLTSSLKSLLTDETLAVHPIADPASPLEKSGGALDPMDASENASEVEQIASVNASSREAELPQRDLVITFGPFSRSLSLQELTEWAETGTVPSGWKFFLNLANIRAEDIQAGLQRSFQIKPRFVNSTLNNLLGEYALYQVGQIVHTPSRMANIQALRSSIMKSAQADNQVSFLELLQNYPLPQMTVDGAKLARLGGQVSRFQSAGGVVGAAMSIEDWLVELQASLAEQVCNCDRVQITPTPITPLQLAPEQRAQYLPTGWQPVASHREDRGNIKVVWLQGTHYEMGYQHGKLLHDEIASIGEGVITALRFAGRGLALGHLAQSRSYPYAVEECRGLADATQDIGITFESCMVLAYGDVFQATFGYTLPKELFWEGCSQFVAMGNATTDGYLYHGSTVDNGTPIAYVIDNPVVFVRQPNNGLPHAFVTYPGVVWPNSGLNVANVSLGLDTALAATTDELSLAGGSNVQIMAEILQGATSYEQARDYMASQPKVQPNIIMAADGRNKQAGVFEFTGQHFLSRPLQDNDVLYATNHFVSEEMYDRQAPPDASTLSRFRRYQQLLEPNGQDSYYGQIAPQSISQILRDRVNPDTLQPSPKDMFDDNASPGGNGSLRQAIFDSQRLRIWVAAGDPPVPENPFVCLSLTELLNFPNATPCEAPVIP